MIIINSLKNCCGCAACANICPKQCITMTEDEKDFVYPKVDDTRCIDCKLCEKVCPLITKTTIHPPISTEAVRSKSLNEVMLSSSGAICHELSKHFLEHRGIVYGAAWGKELTVRHIRVNNISDLEKIRRSKYLQSNLYDSYLKVKDDLTKGLQVLFIGTPCQIAGLKCYLRKDYNNLTTIDFVCHGVPSSAIFNRAIASLEKNKKQKVLHVNFRSKRENWREFGTEFTFQNGDTYYIRHSKSFYFRGFMSNLYLRDCCYDCHFVNHKNHSDLTVADLWGIEYVMPEKDNNTGMNLVIVRTHKGEKLLEKSSAMLERFPYSYNDAVRYNPAIETAPKPHILSNFYWKYQTKLPVKTGVLFTLFIGKILRILGKVK